MARDYRKEYDTYHCSPEQKKRRAMRNAARREAGLSKGDGLEVHHVKPLSKGGSNAPRNRRIVSRHTNRTIGA